MNHMLFLGLGYSSRIVARALADSGWRITGTSRTAAGAEALAKNSWSGLVFDGTQPSAALSRAIRDATHVLGSVPPEAAGDPVLIHHAEDFGMASQLCWLGYFSTIGVYGDSGGGWVDEATPCAPVSERGRRRLLAEKQWLQLSAARRRHVAVFRLPGIYGPGRSAFDQLRAGTARRIIKPGQIFNRIHVDDIAGAVLAAIARPTADGIFNITDDYPSAPDEVVTHAAALLGVEPPPAVAFEAADLSPMARSFYGESKRVSNRRARSELGWTPAYPTYRDGLASILARESSAA